MLDEAGAGPCWEGVLQVVPRSRLMGASLSTHQMWRQITGSDRSPQRQGNDPRPILASCSRTPKQAFFWMPQPAGRAVEIAQDTLS
jgi:hypothetical protein